MADKTSPQYKKMLNFPLFIFNDFLNIKIFYFDSLTIKIIYFEGEFIITVPFGYHAGVILGFNCAEARNLAKPWQIPQQMLLQMV